jgi:hypothetical protein
MLHACDQRFDVTGNLENFCELNKALHDGLADGIVIKPRNVLEKPRVG